MIKNHFSKLSIAEIKKDIKSKGLYNKIKKVLLLNTGDYMASSEQNSIEVNIALKKYNAIDITDMILN